jgi:hypothetical protein
MRKHFLGTIFLTTLVFGCSFEPTPTDTLQEIKVAVETKDAVKFQRYVDVDSVASKAVDAVMGHAMTSSMPSEDSEGFEAIGAALGMAFMETMKPMMVEAIKAALLEAAGQRPVVGSEGQSHEMTSGLAEMFEGSSSSWKASSVKEDGPLAIVSIPFTSEEIGETVLDLKLEKAESGDWRLTELANLSEIFKKQEAVRAKRKAEREAALNKHLASFVDQLTKNLAIDDVAFGYTESKEPFGNHKIGIWIVITNQTDKVLKEARVAVKAVVDEKVVTVMVALIDQLQPGQKSRLYYEKEVNPFYDDLTPVFKALKGGVALEPSAAILDVTYDGESTLSVEAEKERWLEQN